MHTDRLGSTTPMTFIGVTDETGATIQKTIYYPWGQTWATAGSLKDNRFPRKPGQVAAHLQDRVTRLRSQCLNLAAQAEMIIDAVPPPALTPDDPRFPGRDPRYADLKPEELPLTECLKDTVARTLPYWHETIAPAVRAGKRVLIVAHGNSQRGLVKYLDNVSDSDIVELNIPTGIPLVYELDDDLKPIRHYYLGDPEAVARAAEAVAEQAKRKG
jgi:hypothetical protein